MAKLQTAIRGTQDVLPKDSYKWQYVEKTLLETAGLFGFSELRVAAINIVFVQIAAHENAVNRQTGGFINGGENGPDADGLSAVIANAFRRAGKAAPGGNGGHQQKNLLICNILLHIAAEYKLVV